ncbi:unnamed protein product [Amoebophrya sp. A120]|nr:unnamed protein product [Amoebophrya sp. A120]|eukprot:GSA120T00006717001.1
MASPVEARQEVRSFRECVSKKGPEACKQQLQYAVTSVASLSSKDCAPLAEEFFQCYNHKFALSTCDDSTTANLVRCQASTVSRVLFFHIQHK